MAATTVASLDKRLAAVRVAERAAHLEHLTAACLAVHLVVPKENMSAECSVAYWAVQMAVRKAPRRAGCSAVLWAVQTGENLAGSMAEYWVVRSAAC